MKKTICILITTIIFCSLILIQAFASDTELTDPITVPTIESAALEINAKSAILMEASTGTVLYSKNSEDAASPASVTKIMTLLLVAEALEQGMYSLDDSVFISSYAASMGGSQVFLEEGEKMTVDELLKCTVIASANDAAVALAEHTHGSESVFVERMNAKAEELGLKNTNFENVTGLDDTTVNHYSCASDIAVMSRELIKHDIITKYSSMWQDSIRNGEFILTNTNRLVRYYDGCTGLKTGSTDKAGFCVSATAKRGNMTLIAVVMGSSTRDERNNAARTMLDAGFAGYALCEYPIEFIENIPILKGKCSYTGLYSGKFSVLCEKSKKNSIEVKYEIPDKLVAPLNAGEKVGKIVYFVDGEKIGESDICVLENIKSASYIDLFSMILKRIVTGK